MDTEPSGFRNRKWKALTAPHSLTPITGVQRSPLTNVPPEIMLEILSYTNTLGQIMLALTCKRMLGFMVTIPLKMSRFVGKKVLDNKKYMIDLLKLIQPRFETTKMRPGKAKPSWHICEHCLKLRQTKSHWEKKDRYNFRYESQTMIDYLLSWKIKQANNCPECKLLMDLEFKVLHAKQTLAERTQDLRYSERRQTMHW